MPRTNLKLFRVKLRLTQAEIAESIGVNRGTYAAVEKGVRNGSVGNFWNKLQKAYPTANIGELMKVDED